MREWFGLEYLLWRIREEVRRPAIPEMTMYLDKYFFRLKRNKQESMSAWALREEKVYLQMTRALARLEQTADWTEPDWNLLYERQQNWSRWNNWSGAWRTNQGRDTYESVDGECDTAQDAHSWSDREERDGYEVRVQEMEARVNYPSHGQSTKDFLPDVIHGWLVLQRSGLSESSEKTVLGSTENMLGRSRIVEALKQQWTDHELLVREGDRKRDRDRKMRAYVQGETDQWELEMHLNETATESAWNANESRDAREQASWDEAGSWEAEDDQFEGSFADEDEEEAFNLAGT